MEIIPHKCAYLSGTVRSQYVAAFDLDGTIVQALEGKSAGPGNWRWVSERVPELWEKLSRRWTMVIFSNQKRYPGNWNPEKKVQGLLKELGLEGDPFVYLALGGKPYRKPDRGMWDLFLQQTEISPAPQSFFCGDAVGEEAEREEYRWADSDKEFAKNIGIKFYTPDEMWGF